MQLRLQSRSRLTEIPSVCVPLARNHCLEAFDFTTTKYGEHQRRRSQVLLIGHPIFGAIRLLGTRSKHRNVLSESSFDVGSRHDSSV
jgi:hypothetical protein